MCRVGGSICMSVKRVYSYQLLIHVTLDSLPLLRPPSPHCLPSLHLRATATAAAPWPPPIRTLTRCNLPRHTLPRRLPPAPGLAPFVAALGAVFQVVPVGRRRPRPHLVIFIDSPAPRRRPLRPRAKAFRRPPRRSPCRLVRAPLFVPILAQWCRHTHPHRPSPPAPPRCLASMLRTN